MFFELRYACRQLIRHRGLTLVAVLTLSLGIGATTAIYSVLHPVLIEPLPYCDPERLVRVFETLPSGSKNSVSGGAFIDWAEQSSSFERLAVYEPTRFNLSGGGEPQLVRALAVSTEFLGAYGVTPQLGRDFAAGEDRVGGESRVAILGHELWQRGFGAQEELIGSRVTLDQQSYEVIGVLPPAALMETEAEILVPTVIDGDDGSWQRTGHWRSVIGRLHDGVSVAAAEAELQAIKLRMNEHYPPFKEEWGVAAVALQEVVAGDSRKTLFLLFGTVLMVLLIACANVSNLLLARGQSRRQEMAVRGALGADRWRIARQMMTESLLLAALGAIGGLIVAAYGVDLLASTVALELPQAIQPQLDLRVLIFAAALTLGSGMLFGMLPAWRAGRVGVRGFLQDGDRGSTSGDRQRALRLLVVAELAFTLVLLVGAGLFLRSFVSVLRADPGFEPKQTLAFDVVFPETIYPERGDRMAFIDRLRARLAALPGVEAVGAGMFLPLSRSGSTEYLSRADQEPRTDYVVGTNYISGDYLAATGMRLLSGRQLRPSDSADGAERVLLLDQKAAEDLFPSADPIGSSVRLTGADWRVVGVVSSVRHWVLDEAPKPFVYVPQAYVPYASSFVLRSELEPFALSQMARGLVRDLDPAQAVANVRTLNEAVEVSLFGRRTTLTLLGLFAALGLLLASIGIYGVMSYAVSQRRRELAIRTVFGARRLDIVTLVLKDGLKPAWLGITLGAAVAWLAARLVESQLYQVEARDPMVLATSVLILSAVSALAIAWPARRASRADPVRVVRAE